MTPATVLRRAAARVREGDPRDTDTFASHIVIACADAPPGCGDIFTAAYRALRAVVPRGLPLEWATSAGVTAADVAHAMEQAADAWEARKPARPADDPG